MNIEIYTVSLITCRVKINYCYHSFNNLPSYTKKISKLSAIVIKLRAVFKCCVFFTYVYVRVLNTRQ